MGYRLAVLGLLLALSGALMSAQTRAQTPESNDATEKELRLPPIGSPAAEAMARYAIEREKKEYRENIERAQEVARLSAELQKAFEQRHGLSPDDLRKLERIEKLARRIRSEAGGSDGDDEGSDLPKSLEQAVRRLANVAKDLSERVEKTPRQVISASVIEKSNELIELVRLIRRLS